MSRKSITGEERIELAGTGDTLARVELDASEIEVSSVMENGAASRFQTSDGRIVITLQHPASRGEKRVITLRYKGTPKKGITFEPDQVYTAFHTGHWMVCNEDPADKATLTLRLTLPRSLTVVATGRTIGHESVAGGMQISTWRLDRAYSPYLFGFAAGVFRDTSLIADSIRLRLLGATTSPGDMARTFASTEPALRYFEWRSGVPFPDSVYTQVLVNGESGQELATYSWLGEDYAGDVLDDPREDWLVVHELAHQWWGDLLTCRTWSDMWLNEGFATFMTSSFKEYFWGREEYERDILLCRFRYEREKKSAGDRMLHYTDWKTAEEANGTMTYYKGAVVLHLLRYQLGEEKFWEGIKTYTRAHVGGSVESSDLQKAMEAASGEDLSRFFRQWVFGTGAPDLTATYTQHDSDIVVEIVQRQQDAWSLPVQVAVETSAGRITRRVQLDGAKTEVRMPAVGVLLSLRIDDGGHLPVRVDYERSTGMLLYQAAHEPDVAGRIDAIQTLARSQGKDLAHASRDTRSLLENRLAVDPSRLVRSLAESLLDQIRKAEEGPAK